MAKFRGKKKAVTLLELVIVLALMSLVTMLVFNFSSLTQRKEKELDVKQELQHRGNMITESFMSNILQCKNINEVVALNGTPGDNFITSIIINLKGLSYVPSKPSIDNVEKLEYKLINNEMKLIAWRKDASGGIVDEEVQTVAKDVESVKIINKDVDEKLNEKDDLGNIIIKRSLNDSIVKEKIQKSKGVNLEVKLKKKDIEQPITIDLNLRNFN